MDHRILSISEEVLFFGTTSNFDQNGDLVAPASFNRYLRFENQLFLTYGLSPRMTVYGGLNWAGTELQEASRSGNSYGLTDQNLGFNFELLSFENTDEPPSPTSPGDSNALRKIYFQTQVSVPAYNNTTSDLNQLPRLGDQSIDLTAGGFGVLRLIRSRSSEILLTGGAGYTFRTQGFSAAIPWSLSFSYTPASSPGALTRPSGYGFMPGWRAALGLAGNSSLQTDTRHPISSGFLGSGGSQITGAINPTVMSARATVAYALEDNLLISAQVAQTLAGSSSANGFMASLGIQKLIGLSPSRKPPAEMTPEEYGKSNQGFVEYTFEAKVVKSVDRLNLVKIDKGSAQGIVKDQIFDIFSIKSDGTLGDPIARAKVISVKNNEAALSVLEYFKETWIEEGYIAKRPLQ